MITAFELIFVFVLESQILHLKGFFIQIGSSHAAILGIVRTHANVVLLDLLHSFFRDFGHFGVLRVLIVKLVLCLMRLLGNRAERQRVIPLAFYRPLRLFSMG